MEKTKRETIDSLSFFGGWTTRIRTGNDRTKTCSVTITPSSNQMNLVKFACKGTNTLVILQIFWFFFKFTLLKRSFLGAHLTSSPFFHP